MNLPRYLFIACSQRCLPFFSRLCGRTKKATVRAELESKWRAEWSRRGVRAPWRRPWPAPTWQPSCPSSRPSCVPLAMSSKAAGTPRTKASGATSAATLGRPFGAWSCTASYTDSHSPRCRPPSPARTGNFGDTWYLIDEQSVGELSYLLTRSDFRNQTWLARESEGRRGPGL